MFDVILILNLLATIIMLIFGIYNNDFNKIVIIQQCCYYACAAIIIIRG